MTDDTLAADPPPTDGPARAATAVRAIHRQLEQSQWWPESQLRDGQLWQANILISHAWRTVPFYRQRLEAARFREGHKITAEEWPRLPILTRCDIQDAGDRLNSSAVPKDHGKIISTTTSGSTGTPVTVLSTTADARFFKAFGLRGYRWHGLDFARKFGSIRKFERGRAPAPDGIVMDRWGDGGAFPFPTGPAAALNISASTDQQIDWLNRHRPDYLATYPTNAIALIDRCRALGTRLDSIDAVLTTGEVATDEAREKCRAALGARLLDIYSAQEIGIMALQCPDHAHYHVQSESAIVEVLDADGRACAPGEIGRVVVTPLHNFATPLVRYEIGDHAVPGEACDCGRGLPVIKKILGRTRNMLAGRSGETYFPFFGVTRFAEIAPVVQHQFIQKDMDTIEARLVTKRPLTADEEQGLRERVRQSLPRPFEIRFVYVDEIPRNAGGKYEDFVSEVAD